MRDYGCVVETIERQRIDASRQFTLYVSGAYKSARER